MRWFVVAPWRSGSWPKGPPGEDMTAEEPSPRFFYAHVMKTGGSTLRQHAWRGFAADAVYPDESVEGCLDDTQSTFANLAEANRNIAYLVGLPIERLRAIRVFTGHFPVMVAELLAARLDEPLVTMTMLREPVDRVVSHLMHVRRYMPQWAEAPFEEIYEDGLLHAFYFTNYQTRVFAFAPEDAPETHLDQLAMDADRLEGRQASAEFGRRRGSA